MLISATSRAGAVPHARRSAIPVARSAVILILAATSACPRATAALAIETNPQDPLIHPIAPQDGAVAVTNPPAMVFWHTPHAVSYRLELAKSPDFADAVVVDAIALPFYNHTSPLALGRWFWRYRIRTEDGDLSQTSPVRSFSVAPESIPFPVPPVTQLVARMPDHPRIYVTPDTLPDFRRRRTLQSTRAFASLEHACQGSLHTPLESPETVASPLPDPKKRALAFWLTEGGPRRTPNVAPSTLENLSLTTQSLALLFLITGREDAAAAAIQRLLWQANFRVDAHQGDRAHHDTVHCYEYGLKRMAVCFDHLYGRLSNDQRRDVLAAIEYHGKACYRKLRGKVRIHLKYQTSHAQQDMHELLTTALAVAGDLEAATDWLEYLVPQYVNRLAWGGNDGGYSEGHYYNYKWHGMVQCAVALRTATGLDLFSKPRFANAGRFWLYCMSLNYWWDHFGDNFALHTPLSGNSNDRDGANFLASHYRDRYVQWWSNQIDGPLKQPLWYLSDESLPEKPPVDIPQAAAFRDVGWAAMADRFYDSNSTRLFFKSSPWGSHSHCHQDQNSFVIHAFGEILAIDKGYYGYYGDAYHKEICRETRSHNTILVDGKGQGRGIQYNGNIARFVNTSGFCFTQGEAAPAYGDRLERFSRSILFVRPGLFLVFDRLVAATPATFSWQLNALNAMRLDEERQTVEVSERGVVLRATHLLPGGLSYRQDNERAHPLTHRYTEAFPEQWTCWCETPAPTSHCTFLTVLEPFRQKGGSSLRQVERIDTPTAVGASFHYQGRPCVVLFRRAPDTPVAYGAGGVHTDAVCVCAVFGDDASTPVRAFFVDATDLQAGNTRITRTDRPRSGEFAVTDTPPSEVDPPPAVFTIRDSGGTYTVPLERCSNDAGSLFDFGRLDPREPGRYTIVTEPAARELLVRDAWDPAQSSSTADALLREASSVIVRSHPGAPVTAVRAELRESLKGRIVNLLRNGDFEVGTPGYQPRGWWVRHFGNKDRSFPHWTDEDAASGEHCLKLVWESSRIRLYSQRIELRKPGRYVIRFKAKATGKGASVNAWDSAGGFSVPIEPSEDWREYRKDLDLRPGLVRLHCVFETADAPNQTAWFDDMEFGPIAE